MIKTFSYAAVTLQPISSYTPVILNRQVNQSLAVTAFTASLEPWAGASRIFQELRLVLERVKCLLNQCFLSVLNGYLIT